MSKAILYDSTLCVGCRACEEACAAHWGLSYNEQIGKEEKLSERKLTTIKTFTDKAGGEDRYSRRLCMHCASPTCVSVCPVGALQKTALGPVIYDETKCMGCRYCMTACPFQVPVYEWSKQLPRVRKCDMCYQRQLAGKPTACAEACPVGATIAGEREAIVAEAKQRLAAKPDGYYPYIYGLNEAGGTSVLFLAAVPPNQLGLRMDLPQEELPVLTWRALAHVPDVVSIGAVLMGGVYWITHRREEVAKAERTQVQARPRPRVVLREAREKQEVTR
jgi:formate dehydrogenase iron-sulfur subunit